jgi:hypothetical protein
MKDFYGEPIIDGKGQSVTMLTAILNALGARDDKTTGAEMIKKFMLGKKLAETPKILTVVGASTEEADIVDLTTEEIQLITKSIEKIYGPLVVGLVYEVFDPAALK